MLSKKVAVIIPFFNEENYLRGSVESVLKQTFKNIQIILVNDASNDSSEKIAKTLINEHPEKNVDLISHKNNKGLGPARNTGVKYTDASYVLFLDADDWLIDENSIALAVEAISQNNADFAMFNHTLTYEDHKNTKNPAGHQLSLAAKNLANLNQAKIYLLRNHHVAWNKIYTLDLLNKAGKYPPGSYEDIPVSYGCLILAKKIAVIEKSLICYRQRKGAAKTGSQLKPTRVKHFDIFNRYDSVFLFAEKHDASTKLLAEMYNRMLLQFVSIYHSQGRIPKNKRKDFFILMRSYYLKFHKYSSKPASFKNSIIRFLISNNLWRTAYIFFRLYHFLKTKK